MRRIILKVFALLGLALLAGTPSVAVPVAITGYDIQNALTSGLGNWSHTYTGTIADTGSVVTPAGIATVADYTGGAGTLNDGVFADTADAHLFFASDTSGEPINTLITIYLSQEVNVSSISLYGGAGGNPVFPALTGMTISLGGASATLAGSPFDTVNDLFSLSGTVLEGLATDTIVLSGFTSSSSADHFSITEIRVDGVAIPEPAVIALVSLGIAGIWLSRRMTARAG